MIKQDTLENQVNISFLAIGSNLGNRINNIEKAKFYLQNLSIFIIKSSSIYETFAWPYVTDPKFYNIILKIKTNLSLSNLFIEIKKIEKKLGRVNSKKNRPRTCDIDIIDFNGKISYLNIKGQDLIVPHPRLVDRNFVLIPLYEIEKNWLYPHNKRKITDLIDNLSLKSLRAIKQI